MAEIQTSDATGLVLLLKAASFAAQKHKNQRRKDVDASPYINHPLSLAHILASEGGVSNPTVLAAALLHDTVEDTDTTFEELELEFGSEVASIVAEVTDDKSLDKAERKRLQIVKSSAKSHSAKLVKLADKISNLRDIAYSPPADWSSERRREYFDWAIKVVSGMRGTNAALEAAFDRECSGYPTTENEQRHSDERVIFRSTEFWFKIVGMLQHNWALIETQEIGVEVVFFDDLNCVFDRLDFRSTEEAEVALERNGFGRYDDDMQAQEFIAKPANPFSVDEYKMRPIYSGGEYWI